mmetsp:Transcript_63532/g.184251  ORF Transcript_63532/g.184251 Transcript_63532/m.184251 type:complete len:98 (-) Transcript_63532:716-1009(-)
MRTPRSPHLPSLSPMDARMPHQRMLPMLFWRCERIPNLLGGINNRSQAGFCRICLSSRWDEAALRLSDRDFRSHLSFPPPPQYSPHTRQKQPSRRSC